MCPYLDNQQKVQWHCPDMALYPLYNFLICYELQYCHMLLSMFRMDPSFPILPQLK